MKLVIELSKPSSKCRDFLYTLYINGLFICSLHNVKLVEDHIKRHWFAILELEKRNERI